MRFSLNKELANLIMVTLVIRIIRNLFDVENLYCISL